MMSISTGVQWCGSLKLLTYAIFRGEKRPPKYPQRYCRIIQDNEKQPVAGKAVMYAASKAGNFVPISVFKL